MSDKYNTKRQTRSHTRREKKNTLIFKLPKIKYIGYSTFLKPGFKELIFALNQFKIEYIFLTGSKVNYLVSLVSQNGVIGFNYKIAWKKKNNQNWVEPRLRVCNKYCLVAIFFSVPTRSPHLLSHALSFFIAVYWWIHCANLFALCVLLCGMLAQRKSDLFCQCVCVCGFSHVWFFDQTYCFRIYVSIGRIIFFFLRHTFCTSSSCLHTSPL